jgi:hypothetical protein
VLLLKKDPQQKQRQQQQRPQRQWRRSRRLLRHREAQWKLHLRGSDDAPQPSILAL